MEWGRFLFILSIGAQCRFHYILYLYACRTFSYKTLTIHLKYATTHGSLKYSTNKLENSECNIDSCSNVGLNHNILKPFYFLLP